jgi:hypothetical protein
MQRRRNRQEDGFANRAAAGACEKNADRVQNIPEPDNSCAVHGSYSTEPLCFDLAAQDSDDDEADFFPGHEDASTDVSTALTDDADVDFHIDQRIRTQKEKDDDLAKLVDFFLGHRDATAHASRGDCMAVQAEADTRQTCTSTTVSVAAAPQWQ